MGFPVPSHSAAAVESTSVSAPTSLMKPCSSEKLSEFCFVYKERLLCPDFTIYREKAGEMAQGLRKVADPPEDFGSIPSACTAAHDCL